MGLGEEPALLGPAHVGLGEEPALPGLAHVGLREEPALLGRAHVGLEEVAEHSSYFKGYRMAVVDLLTPGEPPAIPEGLYNCTRRNL